MKIALFRSVKFGFDAVMEEKTGHHTDDYVRVSEYLDVEFTMLENPVSLEIEAIKNRIIKLQGESSAEIERLKDKLHELYAQ